MVCEDIPSYNVIVLFKASTLVSVIQKSCDSLQGYLYSTYISLLERLNDRHNVKKPSLVNVEIVVYDNEGNPALSIPQRGVNKFPSSC